MRGPGEGRLEPNDAGSARWMVALRTAAGGPTTERRLTGELDGGDTPGMQMLNEALTLLVEAVDHTAE